MRITAFILLVCCMHVSAATFAQRISVAGKNMPLEQVFEQIKLQTGYTVFANAALLRNMHPLTVDAADMPLRDFLELIMRDQPVSYRIEDKTIMLSRKPFSAGDLLRISKTIKGLVLDTNNLPLPGATVKIKGSSHGVLTDGDGRFSIEASEGDIITISYVGYTDIAMRIKDGGPKTQSSESPLTTSDGAFVFRLSPAKNDLKEVTINAGYYKVNEKLRTGNISRITAKDIERQPITNIMMALQGQMPGITINPFSGIPGQAVEVQIRGNNSLRWDGSRPLFIVNGVPMDSRFVITGATSIAGGFDPLSTLNTADIESIEVLKDADATAIYGSRGANGVILITTKKGMASDKTNVRFDFYKGIGKAVNKAQLMSTREYLDLRYEAFRNDGAPLAGADMKQWDTTRYTDWQKTLLGGTSSIINAQVSISGGNEQNNFRLNTGYQEETAIYPGDFRYRKISSQFSFSHRSKNRKLGADFSISYGLDDNLLSNATELPDAAVSLPPVAPALYNEDGTLNWENGTWENPLASTLRPQRVKSNNLIANTVVSYKIIEGLSAQVNLGYTALQNKDNTKYTIASMDPASVTSNTTASATFSNTQRSSWVVEPQIDYARSFGRHKLTALAAGTIQNSIFDEVSQGAFGFTSDVMLDNIKAAGNSYYIQNADGQYKYQAIFARIGYNFDDKYVLNITGRKDGSSRFGPGRKIANFGSIAAAWIFTEEPFFREKLQFLSFGKLRGSIGSSGTDQIGDYKYFDTYTITAFQYDGTSALTPTSLYNPDYAWERTDKLEAALNLGFLQDRINVELSFYRNRSSNLLIDYPLPTITGFSSVSANHPATIRNTGLEAVANLQLIKKANLRWDLTVNATVPRNKLVAFPNFELSPYASRFVVGESMDIVKVFKYAGVNPQTGLWEVEDMDKDGNIDADDQQYIVPTARYFYGGIRNAITFRQFQLSFLFQFSRQHKAVNAMPFPGLRTNYPDRFLDRWRKPGDQAQIQKVSQNFSTYTPYYYYMNSDARYENADFMRLKTLNLSYTFTERMLRQIGISSAQIFCSGQNLLTLSKYMELDPETGGAMPPLKIFTAGISVSL